jgi:hypothetical protein
MLIVFSEYEYGPSGLPRLTEPNSLSNSNKLSWFQGREQSFFRSKDNVQDIMNVKGCLRSHFPEAVV